MFIGFFLIKLAAPPPAAELTSEIRSTLILRPH
jgi:hypothetical protein